jgi:hypothetical protein
MILPCEGGLIIRTYSMQESGGTMSNRKMFVNLAVRDLKTKE